MTKRLRDWQSRLQRCIAERRKLPFAWGSQDCVLFAADCAGACTGVDLAAEFRGKYSTILTAQRLVDAMGGLGAIAAARLGEEIAPKLAQTGDVGLLLNGGRECLGVFGGAMWLAPGVDGLCSLPASQVLRAWRLEKAEG